MRHHDDTFHGLWQSGERPIENGPALNRQQRFGGYQCVGPETSSQPSCKYDGVHGRWCTISRVEAKMRIWSSEVIESDETTWGPNGAACWSLPARTRGVRTEGAAMRRLLVVLAGIAMVPAGLACQHTAGKCDCLPPLPHCTKYGLFMP